MNATETVETKQNNENPNADENATNTDEWGEFDAERAKATIQKLREHEQRALKLEKQSKALEKKLAEYETAEQERKQAEMSEVERLKAEVEQAKAAQQAAVEEVVTMRIKQALYTQAAQMGFHNPEDAYLMADLTEVELGEDGEVSGVETALKELLKSRPYLAKSEVAPDIDAIKRGKAKDKDGIDIGSLKNRWGI
jgi:hypothetical protein